MCGRKFARERDIRPRVGAPIMPSYRIGGQVTALQPGRGHGSNRCVMCTPPFQPLSYRMSIVAFRRRLLDRPLP